MRCERLVYHSYGLFISVARSLFCSHNKLQKAVYDVLPSGERMRETSWVGRGNFIAGRLSGTGYLGT